MNPRLLLVVYATVMLLPLILAWLTGLPARSFWDEVASGAGMLAFAVILAEFVLSGRFRSVSARLGMDKTMRFHQLVARAALVLMLIHPYLFQAPFSPTYPWDISRQLTLASDPGGLATGVLAWILLPVVIGFAIQRKNLSYRYETWRLIHGIGALLVAGLVMHHTLTLGRYSQAPELMFFWIGLSLIAVGAVANIYLVKPFLQRRRPWKVRSVLPIAKRVWEVTLEPEVHAGLTYDAGQFVWLNIGNTPFSLRENPFSIASPPAAGPELQFIIKELGDFTQTVGQIKPGARAYVDGPHGNLTTTGRSEPGIVFIAGGVGIAALIGILRQLCHENDKRETILIYGNRVAEQVVYRDELQTISQTHGTQIELVLAEPPDDWTGHSGLIDARLIRQILNDSHTRQWLFILCGPPAMMSTVEDTLVEIGVSPDRLLAERFNYD
ncbi:MAG: ferredoxin reductase family protein [Burkholderiaceae bacterium]